MTLVKAKAKVIKTIFPYDDGYGVVITQLFMDDIVLETGVSRSHAESISRKENYRINNGNYPEGEI